jgi:hypothetical protein
MLPRTAKGKVGEGHPNCREIGFPMAVPGADYSSDILIGRTIAKGSRSLDSEQINKEASFLCSEAQKCAGLGQWL